MSRRARLERLWARLPRTQRRTALRLAIAAFSIGGGPGTPSARLRVVLSALSRDNLLTSGGSRAVRRLTKELARKAAVAQTTEAGPVPERPDVSVVIPIYGTLDLLGPQIALLSNDEEIKRSEVILVLDSPELANEFVSRVHQLYALYGIPLRGLVLNQNAGYGIANNLGAANATGSLLLLLNSDVFPIEPGWLSKMTAFYRSRDDIGALAPKLLYEDGSLQHAGMHFEREPGKAAWLNQHFFKGLPSSLAAANVSREVPAVTGACMLIARELFQEVGGFDPAYAIGEYEDSDLCLRLNSKRYASWYFADVALYHLERQSYAAQRPRYRQGATQHNTWLQQERWGPEISRLMSVQDREPATRPEVIPSPLPEVGSPARARKASGSRG